MRGFSYGELLFLDSRDSRYIGLFPESYIVGIVCRKKNRNVED